MTQEELRQALDKINTRIDDLEVYYGDVKTKNQNPREIAGELRGLEYARRVLRELKKPASAEDILNKIKDLLKE